MYTNYWYIYNTVTKFPENETLLNVLCTLRYECIFLGKYDVTMNTEIWIQIYGKKTELILIIMYDTDTQGQQIWW